MPVGTTLSVHSATVGSVICLRHLPIVMTSGMFDPDGTSVSRNLPISSETVFATTPPDSSSHREHCAPSGNAVGNDAGTYTETPNSGSDAFGANTVPETVVDGRPLAAQSTTVQASPLHASGGGDASWPWPRLPGLHPIHATTSTTQASLISRFIQG